MESSGAEGGDYAACCASGSIRLEGKIIFSAESIARVRGSPMLINVLQIAILAMNSAPSSPSWLPSSIRLPGEGGDANGSGNRRRQAIEYRDNEAGAEQGEGEDDSVRAEINQLNRDSSLASQVEGGRTKGKNGLWNEHHERWQQEDA